MEPCDNCDSCKGFNQSRSYNIHELDAASNNSVEDIRSLIEQVRIPPQMGQYSVYIIDEVHMLSSAAFNAFLKTLEEPPRHALFVLATTEKHKILPTILSRCQIFDFNRIQVQDIVGHLKYVALSENVFAEEDALNIIAQKADGGMRDALSIFDQVVSFSGGRITYQQTINNLNVLDYEYYFRLVDGFLRGDIASSLLVFNDIIHHGFDGHNFVAGLSSHFRDLLVCQDPQTLSLLEVGASIRDRYQKQTTDCSLEFLYKAIEIASKCDTGYKQSKNQRLHVEIALMNMANILREMQEKQALLNAKEHLQQARVSNALQASAIPNAQPTAKTQEQASPSSTPSPEKSSIRERIIGNMPKISDALSGKPLVNKQEAQKTENPTSNRSKPFDEKQLDSAWKTYRENQKTNTRLYTMLGSWVVKKIENELVEFQLTNRVQFDQFDSYREPIVLFLRDVLENDTLNARPVVAEAPKKKTLYTQSEKYGFLAEKFPLAETIRERFKLDL